MRWMILALIGLLSLGACNTVEGVGRDVQGAGEAVSEGAKKTKKAIFD